MAAYGVRESDIAKVIDVAPNTLRRHFRRELDTAFIEAGAKVSENPFRIATDREHRTRDSAGSVAGLPGTRFGTGR